MSEVEHATRASGVAEPQPPPAVPEGGGTSSVEFGRAVRRLAHDLSSPIAALGLDLGCLADSLAALAALGPLPAGAADLVTELRDIADNLAAAQAHAAGLLETLRGLGRMAAPGPRGTAGDA